MQLGYIYICPQEHEFLSFQEFCTAKRKWPTSCNFGIVTTTEDDCKQQVLSIILHL